jgi:hypothetical protein
LIQARHLSESSSVVQQDTLAGKGLETSDYCQPNFR